MHGTHRLGSVHQVHAQRSKRSHAQRSVVIHEVFYSGWLHCLETGWNKVMPELNVPMKCSRLRQSIRYFHLIRLRPCLLLAVLERDQFHYKSNLLIFILTSNRHCSKWKQFWAIWFHIVFTINLNVILIYWHLLRFTTMNSQYSVNSIPILHTETILGAGTLRTPGQ